MSHLRRPGFDLYLAAVSLVGAAAFLWLGALPFDSGVLDDPAFWLLAALVLVGELFPIQVHGHQGRETFSTTFCFAMLLVFGLPDTLVVQVATSVVADVIGRRAPDRIGFNVGQLTLSFVAAGLVLEAIDPGAVSGPVEFEELPAVALAGVAFFAVNSILVRTAEALLLGIRVREHLRADLVFRAWSNGLLLALAPPVASEAHDDLFLVPLLALPLAAIHRAWRQASEMEHLALHDGLTGLPNRSYLRDRVAQTVAHARRSGRTVAVLMIDLDRFKDINDTFGHRQGDALLIGLAERLHATCRGHDTVARFGGDEFALMLDDLDGEEAAAATAARVLEVLAEPLSVAGVTLSVDASVGIACFPSESGDADALLQHADSAMYRAKAAQSGYDFYDPTLDEQARTRLALVSELKRALDERELHLHYQPKVELGTGELAGVEALARWDHPRLGAVPPGQFVPLAEHTGLIGRLTEEVLRLALEDARRWAEAGYSTPIAINISARTLLNGTLTEGLGDALRALAALECDPEVEITERVLVSDPARARDAVARLRELGCRVSIDDFGVGYSSLAYLQRLDVDAVKIDRTFVSQMEGDRGSEAIVRTVIDLARNLGLETVAEGVETPDVLGRLGELGCGYAQGFHIARPMPAAALVAWQPGPPAPASSHRPDGSLAP